MSEFEQIVTVWAATAKHPKTGRLHTEMVYQPMLEMLAYLRANGFKTYIVSGDGVEFMRRWVERIQQAIGRRPIIAFGYSDGDFEMLEWTTTAPGPRLGVIVRGPTTANRTSDAWPAAWTRPLPAAGWSWT